MKVFLLFSFCFLLVQASFSQSEDFYKKVLNENVSTRNGYFVALDVKSNSYNGRVIITNGNLLYFLTETEKFDKRQNNEFVTKLLANKSMLSLKKVTLDRDGYSLKVEGFDNSLFLPVNKIEEVEQTASKGCKEFIDRYFNKVYLSLKAPINVDYKKRNAIVNKLFEWQIATLVDDETGYIIIGNKEYECPLK